MTILDDRYELGALLGTGGMANVHSARDLLLHRDVAVKIFHQGIDPARIEVESRLMAQLSHPALVAVLDSGTTGTGQAFLVLQLVRGETLAQRLRRGPLTASGVVALGQRLAEGLAAVHAARVVHRDVKPANILLDEHEQARLTDFGIAQAVDEQALTATGLTMGTIPYLSPEQVRGQRASAASDIYALGLVLLEALTGRREYPGTTAEAALARLQRPPLVPANLPAPFPDLLSRMTRNNPAGRPTATQAAQALATGVILIEQDTEAVSVTPAAQRAPLRRPPVVLPRQARPARTRRPAAVLTVAAALAVGGLSLSVLGGEQQRPLDVVPASTGSNVASNISDVSTGELDAEVDPAVTPTLRPEARTARVDVARVDVKVQTVSKPVSQQLTRDPCTARQNAAKQAQDAAKRAAQARRAADQRAGNASEHDEDRDDDDDDDDDENEDDD